MSWGIIVTECGGRYSTLTIAAGEMVEDLKRRLEGEGQEREYGTRCIAAKNEIADEYIDELSKRVCETVDRANEDNSFDIRKELSGLL